MLPAAIIGGSIISGLFGSRSAKKAAATQAESTREGIASQERMFERQLELQEPFRQGGLEAQNMLMRELRSPRQYRPSIGLSARDISRQQFQGTAGLSPGEIGTQQYRATGAGAGAGMDPRAIAADPEGYQRMLAGARDQEARMPGSTFLGQGGAGGVSLAAGDIAQRQFQNASGLSPTELANQQFNFQSDPGYGFRLSEGLKAIEQGAAARGGLLSGNTLKASQRFGQDLASQEYGNAFQRFQQERAARAGLGQMEYGRFADEQARRMGLGQMEYGQFANEQARRLSAGQMEYGRFADDISRRQALGQMEYGQFAGERSARMLPLMQTVASGQGLTSNIAGQMANLGAAQAGAAGQIGAAGAAGQIGAANALMSGIGQGANLYMQNQFMNRYFGGGAEPGVTRTVYAPPPPYDFTDAMGR